jgi:hypothetical protein
VLALGLLVAREYERDDSGVRSWCAEVLADSPSYVDGELWKAPDFWRQTKRSTIAPPFKSFIQKQHFEVRSGVKFALAGWQGPGRVDVVPTLNDLDTYIKMLFADAKKSPLLGPGGPDLSNGGCRRSTYIMPRVARLVDSHHAALKSALDRGIEEAKDSQPSDVSGKTGPSPQKPRLKEIVAEQGFAIEALSVFAKGQSKLRGQAVRRAATTRENVTAAVERRSEKAEQRAASWASETVEAAAHERDAAISRADVAEAELRTLRQKLRLAEKKQSDPPALKRKDKEICELRAENHTLRVAASTHARDLAAAREAAETARQDYGEAYLPSRPSGKGAGRGRPHGPQLRGCYGKLLMLGVSAPNLNEVFATCAEV